MATVSKKKYYEENFINFLCLPLTRKASKKVQVREAVASRNVNDVELVEKPIVSIDPVTEAGPVKADTTETQEIKPIDMISKQGLETTVMTEQGETTKEETVKEVEEKTVKPENRQSVDNSPLETSGQLVTQNEIQQQQQQEEEPTVETVQASEAPIPQIEENHETQDVNESAEKEKLQDTELVQNILDSVLELDTMREDYKNLKPDLRKIGHEFNEPLSPSTGIDDASERFQETSTLTDLAQLTKSNDVSPLLQHNNEPLTIENQKEDKEETATNLQQLETISSPKGYKMFGCCYNATKQEAETKSSEEVIV